MLHIPFNIWRAEWIKTARRPFNQILFLTMPALVVAVFLGGMIGVVVAPERFREPVRQVLPFPHCLTFIAQVAVVMGQLSAVVFVAQSVGSEYSRDTWKMILPRHGQRLAFLVTKMGMALVGMLLALLTMVLVGLALSWLGTTLLDLQAPPTVIPVTIAELWLGIGVTLLPMLLYASVTLLVTIATRSAVGGALLSFFGLQTVALLSPLYGALAIVMPYPHLPNIIERWSFRDSESLNQVTQGFGYAVSPLASIAVVVTYCGVAMLIAALLFYRRDITGE